MISTSLAQELSLLHADLCSALADPTRLVLLYALANHPSFVTDLSQELGIAQPTISRHLKALRERGLVAATRQGTNILYTLADTRVIDALDILRSILHDRIERQSSLIHVE